MTRQEKLLSLLRIRGYYLCEYCVKGVKVGSTCHCKQKPQPNALR